MQYLFIGYLKKKIFLCIYGDYAKWPKKHLKGPKHEIFEIEFFTQIRPVRIGDLGTGEKN
jgi:hypothetical protein